MSQRDWHASPLGIMIPPYAGPADPAIVLRSDTGGMPPPLDTYQFSLPGLPGAGPVAVGAIIQRRSEDTFRFTAFVDGPLQTLNVWEGWVLGGNVLEMSPGVPYGRLSTMDLNFGGRTEEFIATTTMRMGMNCLAAATFTSNVFFDGTLLPEPPNEITYNYGTNTTILGNLELPLHTPSDLIIDGRSAPRGLKLFDTLTSSVQGISGATMIKEMSAERLQVGRAYAFEFQGLVSTSLTTNQAKITLRNVTGGTVRFDYGAYGPEYGTPRAAAHGKAILRRTSAEATFRWYMQAFNGGTVAAYAPFQFWVTDVGAADDFPAAPSI